MEIENFIELFKDLFRAEVVEENESKVVFSIPERQNIDLDKEYFNYKVDELTNKLNKDETEISNEKYFEVLAKAGSRTYAILQQLESRISDEINGIEYSYEEPSDEYILYLMEQIIGPERQITRRIFAPNRYLGRNQRVAEQAISSNQTVFEVLRQSLRLIKTIKIKSQNPIKKIRFEQFMYSYLFHISYNLNHYVYPLRYFDELFFPLRVGRHRRLSREELESPKRTYINDLILHYQKGVSSESLDHQYLSFYHIFEHFFEKIYNEDLIDKMREELTLPGFSYKRKTDIEKLIKIIQRRLKYKNEEFQINELEALELVLRKYIIDLENLKEELGNINPDLIEFFKSNEVPFSKGNKVNFEVESEVFKNLSKRIYYTRNSIVHSKETEKGKYVPFRDDKDLLNEIYLMRILAEQVIIGTSKEI